MIREGLGCDYDNSRSGWQTHCCSRDRWYQGRRAIRGKPQPLAPLRRLLAGYRGWLRRCRARRARIVPGLLCPWHVGRGVGYVDAAKVMAVRWVRCPVRKWRKKRNVCEKKTLSTGQENDNSEIDTHRSGRGWNGVGRTRAQAMVTCASVLRWPVASEDGV